MRNAISDNVYNAVFYLLLALTIFSFIDVLRRNYAFYKKIRLKRIFLRIPKDYFSGFSSRKKAAAKKYNTRLLIFHLLMAATILYEYMVITFLDV